MCMVLALCTFCDLSLLPLLLLCCSVAHTSPSPLLLLLTLALLLLYWQFSYLHMYAHTQPLLFGIALFTALMSSLLSTSSTTSLFMSWEGLTLVSAALVLFVHSDLACVSCVKAVTYNAATCFCLLIYLTRGLSLSSDCLALYWLLAAGWVKSAMYCASGWLVDAMCAPVIVSALLQSATLVIALVCV